MTSPIRMKLIAAGKIKAAAAEEGVHADPRAIKARLNEHLAQKTARAMAILNAAVRRGKQERRHVA